MLLTPKQQSIFWAQWAKACAAQQWTPDTAPLAKTRAEIEAERKALLARAGFTSLTLVDRGRGFDRVLHELARLQWVSTADDAQRQRYLFVITRLANGLGGMDYAWAIARDKFRLTRGLHSLADLSHLQLRQLIITLNARAQARRRDQVVATVPEEADCPF